jgi:hypothetical protein
MSTYAERLAAEDKDLVVVWDLEDLETRFVSHAVPELDNPSGWTVFYGAIPGQDSGSELDVYDGRLTVGGSSFEIPDVDATVTAWLREHEADLAQASVIRREGFVGVAESEWQPTYWNLRNYGAAGRRGGGFRFELDNVLGQTAAEIFVGYSQSSRRLDADLLSSETTSFDLDMDPPGDWLSGGTLLIWNSETELAELVTYSGISGTTVSILSRDVYGVGAGSSATFAAADTSVYRVWVRRDDPISLVLRLLLTNPEQTGPDANVAIEEGFSDPGLDELDWPLEADGPYTDGWKADEPGSCQVLREDDDVHGGGTAIRLQGAGGDAPAITRYGYALQAFDAGGYWALSFYQKDVDAGAGLEVTIASRVAGTGADSQWWNDSTQDWEGSAVANSTPDPGTDGYVRTEMIFPGFDSNDRVIWVELRVGAVGATSLVDSIRLRGPYALEPTSIWDDGSGEGLGLPPETINIEAMERIQARDLRSPTFDGSGNLVSGTALLFAEVDPIDDVKEWIEDQLLRPFGLWPTIDDSERFSLSFYAETPSTPFEIGDEWVKGDFRASGWSRSIERRVNYLQLSTDYTPGLGGYGSVDTIQSQTSVSRFGRSKLKKIETRGGRTGLYGFPDYASQLALTSAAGRLFVELAGPNGAIEVTTFYRWRGANVGSEVALNVPLPDLSFSAGAGREISGGIFRVVRRQIDGEAGRVLLLVRQPLPAIRAAFVAPDSVASSYSAASDADKRHAYISPDSGTFADGSEGYKVI